MSEYRVQGSIMSVVPLDDNAGTILEIHTKGDIPMLKTHIEIIWDCCKTLSHERYCSHCGKLREDGVTV